MNKDVPYEVTDKFNIGAFLSPWIWGIGNKVWIALLGLIPALNIIVSIYVLFKGNELAWNNRKFDDVEHFFNVQRRWLIIGLVYFAVNIILGFIVSSALIHHFMNDLNKGVNNY